MKAFRLLRPLRDLGVSFVNLLSCLSSDPPVDIRVLVGDQAKLYFEFTPKDLLCFSTGSHEAYPCESTLFTPIQLSMLEGKSHY